MLLYTAYTKILFKMLYEMNKEMVIIILNKRNSLIQILFHICDMAGLLQFKCKTCMVLWYVCTHLPAQAINWCQPQLYIVIKAVGTCLQCKVQDCEFHFVTLRDLHIFIFYP